jgi:hypothetical protein
VQVGRTYRGQGGLQRRLSTHLGTGSSSSFTWYYLDRKGSTLRNGFTFQYLEVEDVRARALLEHFATAWHCPKYLRLGQGE